jgi:predicted DNA-binding protein (MmcQ/YjbR family)
MATDPFHDRLLAIVLGLPGAYEDRPWGSVHCKVGGKIFVGWGRRDDGEMELGFRTDLELQSMLVASDPRFKIAKYVGQYGGVDMCLGPKPNWAEVEHFIVESYRRIAPKKLVKELDARDAASGLTVASPPARTGKAALPKAAAGKRPAAKKPAASSAPKTSPKTAAKTVPAGKSPPAKAKAAGASRARPAAAASRGRRA